ncbi:MAG TPA: excinuclease ABC subunit UvrC [Burkholderiales bacterium]|nr:excinuclease ABC subunit UvrC [Burkholderiales bacterium]
MILRRPALPPQGRAGTSPSEPFDAQTLVANLPGTPGVYRMIGAQGEVLYVGKAGDLKKRVSSYFQKTQHGPRTAMMLTQVASVEITVTRSEAEALILENNLIKSLGPRYNILFRDDKSYPYLMVSGEEFPRLGFHRGAMDKTHHYFGPFPHAGAVRESIQLLQRVFRLRTCENSVFQNRSRPCLLYQIRRCTAPCVGLIGAPAYAEDVKGAQLYLEGRSDAALKRLEVRMQRASDARRYEEAAAYRDQIQSLAKVSQRQYADTGDDVDVDVIAVAMDGGVACVNLMMVRGGLQLGDRSLFPQNAEERDAKEVLAAFIAQHYLERPVPPLIVAGEDLESAELEAGLAEHSKHAVRIVTRPTADRRAWLEMARENALQALKARLAEQSTQGARLTALREALGLPDTAQRIECFDISHTMGEATVAACVVYDRMDMRRGEYRRYNIEGLTPGDDYAALNQALARRYGRIASGEGVAPDAIFIDGGKGQLGAARAALAEVGVSDIALVGIAKGPERKPGLEELWIGERVVKLAPDHPGLHLIQHIRDEAHRFAIAGHRARRSKRRTTSSLEGIAGIGAKRRKQLLTRFGGLKGVMGASVEDLTQVEGISRKLAEKIYRELHAA